MWLHDALSGAGLTPAAPSLLSQVLEVSALVVYRFPYLSLGWYVSSGKCPRNSERLSVFLGTHLGGGLPGAVFPAEAAEGPPEFTRASSVGSWGQSQARGGGSVGCSVAGRIFHGLHCAVVVQPLAWSGH